MRILVGWDTPAETALLQLYLAGGGGNEVALATQTDPFLAEANEHDWDVVLLTLTFPTLEKGFAVFEKVQQLQPGVPVVRKLFRPSRCLLVHPLLSGFSLVPCGLIF